jgi:hypothetical protein
MLIVFLVLTGLSVVDLIVGTVWTAVAFGQTRRRSGPEVGAEMTAERMARGTEGHTRPQYVYFEGEAASVEKEASLSLAEIKQGLKAGQWRQMLPVLLAIEGFLGLLLFGAVTAWVGIENRLVAGFIAVAALYALVRTVIAFARA